MPRLAFILYLLLFTQLPAATVRQVIGRASSPENTILSDGQKFTTGPRSKSSVALDKGFFRVGSDTNVQVVTSNNLSLEKGIMLAGSDPARFRRTPVTVTAPGYKLEVKGTAQIAYYPGAYVKITVLEGKVRVGLQSLSGEWETLEPGQMLIINPSDKRLPEPVFVDISRLAATSQLIGGAFAELSTQGLIDAAAAAQGLGLLAGDLTQTTLRLRGAAPEVSVSLPNRTPPTPPSGITPDEASVFQVVDDLSNPNAIVERGPYRDGALQPFVTGEINRDMQQTQARAREWVVTMDNGGQLFGSITADPAMFAGSNRKLSFVGNGTVEVLTGANIRSPDSVALNLNAIDLIIDQAELQAGTAQRTDEVLTLASGSTGNIQIIASTLKGGKADISTAGTGTSITVDDSTIEAPRGVLLGKSTTNANITIQNSSQILALLGALDVLAQGGSITVTNSTLKARDKLTIDAQARAATATGIVEITDATLMANVIRIRAGANGANSLIIDGSTLQGISGAAQLIKLYAGDKATLVFRNNVTLNANQVHLSGLTVRVDAGGSVTISGAGHIYTTNKQFNGGGNVSPGHGTITAGQGLQLHPLSPKPAF